MSIEIAVIGPQRPFVLEALEREFTVHKVWEAGGQDRRARAGGGAASAARSPMRWPACRRSVIQALPNLEICAIMGVGLETTDLGAARERGVVVTTTPVLYDDVADLGVILALCACRRIVEADRFVRSGRWLQGRIAPARKFSGKRAGILGLGRIGTALAPRLAGIRPQHRLLRPAAEAGRAVPGVRLAARARAELRHPVPVRGRRPRRRPYRDGGDPGRAGARGHLRQRRARLAGRRGGAGAGAQGRPARRRRPGRVRARAAGARRSCSASTTSC